MQIKILFSPRFFALVVTLMLSLNSIAQTNTSSRYDSVQIQKVKLSGVYIYKEDKPSARYLFTYDTKPVKVEDYVSELDDYEGRSYFYGKSSIDFVYDRSFDRFEIRDTNLVVEIGTLKIKVGESISILKSKFRNSFNTYLKEKEKDKNAGFIVLFINKGYYESNLYIETSEDGRITTIFYARI